MDFTGANSEPLVSEEYPSLFHYTSEGGLYGILESQELWATHYEYLNDREEFRAARSVLRSPMVAAIRALLEKLASTERITLLEEESIDTLAERECENILNAFYQVTFRLSSPFIFSFCAHNSASHTYRDGLLSQWRGYGKDGGYGIEFGAAALEAALRQCSRKNSHSGYSLAAVIYGEESPDLAQVRPLIAEITRVVEPMLMSFLDGTDPRAEIDKTHLPFIQIASRMKHPGFAEENEIRLVHLVPDKVPADRKAAKRIEFRVQRGERVPYVKLLSDCGPLPIKRILIGPHPRATIRKRTLERFLLQRGLDIPTEVSGIPYLPE